MASDNLLILEYFPLLTLTKVGWGLYEAIRLKTVELGYYPDKALYEGNPLGLSAAIDAIKSGGTRPVNVVPDIPIKDQGALEYGTIYVSLTDIENGQIGLGGAVDYTDEGVTDKATQRQYSDNTKHLNYIITLYGRDLQQIDEMRNIMSEAIPDDITEVPAYDFDNKTQLDTTFTTVYQDETIIKDTDAFELKIVYQVQDILLRKPLEREVAVIKEVNKNLFTK